MIKKFLFTTLLFFFGFSQSLIALEIYNMKTFGSVGLGWSSERISIDGEEKGLESNSYYELSIGEELSFDNYNGVQVYASEGRFQNIKNHGNLNKGIFTIGANYVLESGKFFNGLQLSLLTGFDMGARFSQVFNENNYFGVRFVLQTKNSKDPNKSAIKSSFVMDYNLGIRLRDGRYALSWNVKFPLFSSDTPIQLNAYIPNKTTLFEGKITSCPITTTFNFIFFL